MMKSWLQRIEGQLNVLTLRERGLVFLSGVAVIAVIWNLLLFTPQNAVRESLNSQMLNIQQKLNARAQEANVLAQLVGVNIDQGKVKQLAQLKVMSAALEDKVTEISKGLVPAGELLGLLKDVLERSDELTIQRVEFLPPVAMNINHTSKTVGSYAPVVFKHTVELTLQGSYFDLLHYLQGLEDLSWRLYWDSLSYQVNEYPIGDIELRISTLSISGGLFEKESR